MNVAKIRMLRQMYGKIRKDRIRNERFREHVGVVKIEDKSRETCLRWFENVQRKPVTTSLRKSLVMEVDSPPR